IEARVEAGVRPEHESRGLHEENGQGQVAAALLDPRLLATAERVERGEVRLVVLRHVRDQGPGQGQVLGTSSPDAGQRLSLDRSPLLEAGQRRKVRPCRKGPERSRRLGRGCPLGTGRGRRPPGPGRGYRLAGGGADIRVGDASTGSRAVKIGEGDAELPSQATRRGSGGRWETAW